MDLPMPLVIPPPSTSRGGADGWPLKRTSLPIQGDSSPSSRHHIHHRVTALPDHSQLHEREQVSYASSPRRPAADQQVAQRPPPHSTACYQAPSSASPPPTAPAALVRSELSSSKLEELLHTVLPPVPSSLSSSPDSPSACRSGTTPTTTSTSSGQQDSPALELPRPYDEMHRKKNHSNPTQLSLSDPRADESTSRHSRKKVLLRDLPPLALCSPPSSSSFLPSSSSPASSSLPAGAGTCFDTKVSQHASPAKLSPRSRLPRDHTPAREDCKQEREEEEEEDKGTFPPSPPVPSRGFAVGKEVPRENQDSLRLLQSAVRRLSTLFSPRRVASSRVETYPAEPETSSLKDDEPIPREKRRKREDGSFTSSSCVSQQSSCSSTTATSTEDKGESKKTEDPALSLQPSRRVVLLPPSSSSSRSPVRLPPVRLSSDSPHSSLPALTACASPLPSANFGRKHAEEPGSFGEGRTDLLSEEDAADEEEMTANHFSGLKRSPSLSSARDPPRDRPSPLLSFPGGNHSTATTQQLSSVSPPTCPRRPSGALSSSSACSLPFSSSFDGGKKRFQKTSLLNLRAGHRTTRDSARVDNVKQNRSEPTGSSSAGKQREQPGHRATSSLAKPSCQARFVGKGALGQRLAPAATTTPSFLSSAQGEGRGEDRKSTRQKAEKGLTITRNDGKKTCRVKEESPRGSLSPAQLLTQKVTQRRGQSSSPCSFSSSSSPSYSSSSSPAQAAGAGRPRGDRGRKEERDKKSLRCTEQQEAGKGRPSKKASHASRGQENEDNGGDAHVFLSDLDSEEEEKRVLDVFCEGRRRRERSCRRRRGGRAPRRRKGGKKSKRKSYMKGDESDCDDVFAQSEDDDGEDALAQHLRPPDRILKVGERCLDMERGVEAHADFFQLNVDERALWLNLKFLDLYLRTCDKSATPGSMSRSLRKMRDVIGDLFPTHEIGPGSLRIAPGFRCVYTGQLTAVGLHLSFNERMAVGEDGEGHQTATSLLLNDHRLEDYNDIIIVYGEESDGKGYNAYPGDQMIYIGGPNTKNYCLWQAWKCEYPVRVIRGYKCKSRYAPSFGYRYDGLYRVVEMLEDTDNGRLPFLSPGQSPEGGLSSHPSSPSSSCATPPARQDVSRHLPHRQPFPPLETASHASEERESNRQKSSDASSSTDESLTESTSPSVISVKGTLTTTRKSRLSCSSQVSKADATDVPLPVRGLCPEASTEDSGDPSRLIPRKSKEEITNEKEEKEEKSVSLATDALFSSWCRAKKADDLLCRKRSERKSNTERGEDVSSCVPISVCSTSSASSSVDGTGIVDGAVSCPSFPDVSSQSSLPSTPAPATHPSSPSRFRASLSSAFSSSLARLSGDDRRRKDAVRPRHDSDLSSSPIVLSSSQSSADLSDTRPPVQLVSSSAPSEKSSRHARKGHGAPVEYVDVGDGTTTEEEEEEGCSPRRPQCVPSSDDDDDDAGDNGEDEKGASHHGPRFGRGESRRTTREGPRSSISSRSPITPESSCARSTSSRSFMTPDGGVSDTSSVREERPCPAPTAASNHLLRSNVRAFALASRSQKRDERQIRRSPRLSESQLLCRPDEAVPSASRAGHEKRRGSSNIEVTIDTDESEGFCVSSRSLTENVSCRKRHQHQQYPYQSSPSPSSRRSPAPDVKALSFSPASLSGASQRHKLLSSSPVPSSQSFSRSDRAPIQRPSQKTSGSLGTSGLAAASLASSRHSVEHKSGRCIFMKGGKAASLPRNPSPTSNLRRIASNRGMTSSTSHAGKITSAGAAMGPRVPAREGEGQGHRSSSPPSAGSALPLPSSSARPCGSSADVERPGRRVYKFVLVAIHRDVYLPKEAKIPADDVGAFEHSVFEEDKNLKKLKMLVYNHYKVHCKVQEELLKGAAPPPSAGGAPWPYPPSCSLKVVQAYSDLPFRFALAVPPVLKLAGQTQSILSNFTCIVAAAYKIYLELKVALDPSALSHPSGALLALYKYQAAVAAASARRGYYLPRCGASCSSSESQENSKPHNTTDYDPSHGPLAPPLSSSFSSSSSPLSCQTVTSSSPTSFSGASRQDPLPSSTLSRPSFGSSPAPCWAVCGMLPLKIVLTRLDLELGEVSRLGKQKLIEMARRTAKMHPPGWIEKQRDAAVPSFSKNQEELDELLQQLRHKKRLPDRHRPLRWTERRTEILVNAELAKVFSHQILPQSATCGIYTTIELCSPLPDTWSPWTDISQGKERFPIPAFNNVDCFPPPVDFSYQVRNVCFTRLPNFSMLCLCAGCVPPGEDTSQWERIEVEGYSSAIRDPATGQVYCAGSNLRFITETSTLAACTSYCLCDKSRCTNRYPEDLAFPVMVCKTRAAGWELRTKYVGEMICRATMEGRSRHNSRRGYHNYCMEIVQDEWDWEDNWKLPCIDSLFMGNASRFLNHSCEPNVDVRNIWRGPLLPVVGVFARRTIKAGESLTYAYGAGYESMKCWCGAKTCKGYIGGDGDKKDGEQRRTETDPPRAGGALNVRTGM